ncbi:hypothetical protein ACVWXP_003081 [Bradyrhizobium sp. USDA 4463]
MAPGGTLGRSQNTRSTLLEAKSSEQVYVTCEPVQLREDEFGACHFGVGKGRRQLGPVVAFAAFDLDVFSEHLPSAAV